MNDMQVWEIFCFVVAWWLIGFGTLLWNEVENSEFGIERKLHPIGVFGLSFFGPLLLCIKVFIFAYVWIQVLIGSKFK